MKTKIFLSFMVLALILVSCEKEEDRVYLTDNPTLPTLVDVPSLDLLPELADDTMVFIGTPLDPGFSASVSYSILAAAAGTNFDPFRSLWTGPQDTAIRVPVKSLNVLLSKFVTKGVASPVEFRIKATLVTSAGDPVPGKEPVQLEFLSDPVTADVIIY